MISVFQTYFDKESKKHLDPMFIPFENLSKDGYFENTVIKKVYEQLNNPFDHLSESEYVGISSWKMHKKTRLTGQEIIDFIQKDINARTQKDVYLYTPIVVDLKTCIDYDINPPLIHGTIQSMDIWQMHKNLGIHPFDANTLLNDSKVLPFDLFDGKWIYCHCNYWIAKKSIFDEYCENVLFPFIDFFERRDIKQHAASVAWYKHRHEGIMYPSYAFTAEGLFGSFLAHSTYTYSYICKMKIKKRIKWVQIDN